MLRSSLTLHGRGLYHRIAFAPVNHHRIRWHPPRRAHRATPIANKMTPEEVANTEDQRRGVDWYNRVHKRKEYRHWPFVRMTDDPIRKHKNPTLEPSRAFSQKDTKCVAGTMEWDYYAATDRDYQLASTVAVRHMAPFIALFTAKVWSEKELKKGLMKLERRFPSIKRLAMEREAAITWNRKTGAIPPNMLQHAIRCSLDIMMYNRRKRHREKMQKSAVLRDNEMSQYFALPYLTNAEAANVPVEKAQPKGVFPEGDLLYLRSTKAVNHHIQPTRYSQTRLM